MEVTRPRSRLLIVAEIQYLRNKSSLSRTKRVSSWMKNYYSATLRSPSVECGVEATTNK